MLHIVIKANRFRHLNVPQYDGLNVDKMLEFGNNYQNLFKFLPDPVEIKKCPKQWLINVIFTIVKTPFADWVSDLIEARNHKIAVDKNLLIEMDPDVAEAYAASTAVSSKYIVLQNIINI